MRSKIRVLVAAELALMREGVSRLLEGYEDIDVVEEAADGKETIDRAHDLQPDVVLMDITLKVMNGFEATRRLTRQAAKTKVIILTERETKDSVATAFLSGARGCIPKAASSAELASAIKAVHSGEMYLHPSLAETVIQAYLSLRKIEAPEDPYEQLTDRQRHVLRLVGEGRTTREIAQDLGITLKTALGHRSNVMKKLGLHRQAELIKYAIQRHLVDLEPRK